MLGKLVFAEMIAPSDSSSESAPKTYTYRVVANPDNPIEVEIQHDGYKVVSLDQNHLLYALQELNAATNDQHVRFDIVSRPQSL